MADGYLRTLCPVALETKVMLFAWPASISSRLDKQIEIRDAFQSAYLRNRVGSQTALTERNILWKNGSGSTQTFSTR